jgi:hypothetical protein
MDKVPQFNFSALHLIHDPQAGPSHPYWDCRKRFVILKLKDKAPQFYISALHLSHDPHAGPIHP